MVLVSVLSILKGPFIKDFAKDRIKSVKWNDLTYKTDPKLLKHDRLQFCLQTPQASKSSILILQSLIDDFHKRMANFVKSSSIRRSFGVVHSKKN